MNRRSGSSGVRMLFAILIAAGLGGVAPVTHEGLGSKVAIDVNSPMAPPDWGFWNASCCGPMRKLVKSSSGVTSMSEAISTASSAGGDDGPDDASENFTDWTILHAIGASDSVLNAYKKGWEGHLRQFTAAKTKDVPFAREGMYFKEFPVMFDWLHNGEGLNPFQHARAFRSQRRPVPAPGDPLCRLLHERGRRCAQLRLRAQAHPQPFNGSRGPLFARRPRSTGPATRSRSRIGSNSRHGEDSYAQMLEHFRATTTSSATIPKTSLRRLPLNAYMLTHEEKYKEWLLGYVDAWRERMIDNGGIIPTMSASTARLAAARRVNGTVVFTAGDSR